MTSKYNQIEAVLGEGFDPELLPKMEQEWKTFYNNPEQYRGTVIINMVNQWIDESPLRWWGN